MKQTEQSGLRITDYTAKDAARMSLKFIGNGTVNTILYLTAQDLADALDREEYRTRIETADLIRFSEPLALELLGFRDKVRQKEVEEDHFFIDMVKRFARAKQTVFLVAENKENLDALGAYIREIHENVQVAGSYLWESETASAEEMVNEINDVSPNVILSILPFELQGKLMDEQRSVINADLWIARTGVVPTEERQRGLGLFLWKLFYRNKLKQL